MIKMNDSKLKELLKKINKFRNYLFIILGCVMLFNFFTGGVLAQATIGDVNILGNISWSKAINEQINDGWRNNTDPRLDAVYAWVNDTSYGSDEWWNWRDNSNVQIEELQRRIQALELKTSDQIIMVDIRCLYNCESLEPITRAIVTKDTIEYKDGKWYVDQITIDRIRNNEIPWLKIEQ